MAIIALDVASSIDAPSFRTPVLAVAIGIYLPLELSVPIFAGGLISMLASRGTPAGGQSREPGGLLFAAGLITGEALIGILMAIPIVVASDPDVFALPLQAADVRRLARGGRARACCSTASRRAGARRHEANRHASCRPSARRSSPRCRSWPSNIAR